MEKLYCVDISYKIKGKRYNLFGNIKDVSIQRYLSDKYIICEEEDLNAQALLLIKKAHSRDEAEIRLKGKTSIFNWGEGIFDCNNITIYTIKSYEIDSISYSEATIEECIQQLTPSEYNRLYGDILKVGKIDD